MEVLVDPLANYIYFRALQLEGRFPNDEGAWPITVLRLFCGWGLPPEEACTPLKLVIGQPFPEPQKFAPFFLKQHRLHYYQRIRSSGDCVQALRNNIEDGGNFISMSKAAFE